MTTSGCRSMRRSNSSSLQLKNESSQPRRLSLCRLCRVGAGRIPIAVDDAHNDRDRCQERRALRAKSLQRRLWRPDRLFRRQRDFANRDRRPHRIHRPQRHFGFARRLGPSTVVGQGGAGPRSLRGACRFSCRWPRGEQREVVFILVPARTLTKPAHGQRFRGVAAARTALDAVKAYWDRTLGAVLIHTPDRIARTCWPTVGWSIRRWPAGCGPAAATTSRAARLVFAISFRTSMALVYAEPRLTREHLLRASEHQFREGDVQHWWHPPKIAACAPVSPTTFSGWPWPPAAMCRRPATLACWTSGSHFIEGRLCKPDEESITTLPRARTNLARSTSIACGRSSTACVSASMDCR